MCPMTIRRRLESMLGVSGGRRVRGLAAAKALAAREVEIVR
jgi:hypothetical protein